MNGLPYYRRFPRDFIEGTIGMPFELKTTYAFVLDLIYMQGGELPDDARYIAGLLGVSVRKWKSLRQGLIDADKLVVSGDFLTNHRAVSELESLAKLSRKQSENRSRPNKNNALASPAKNHTESESESEKKSSVPSEPRQKKSPREELLVVLDEERADAVIEHRQRKRAPLTQRAAKMLAGKFAECPDPNKAADAMIVNGWQGFEPEWLANRSGPGPPHYGRGRRRDISDLLAEQTDHWPPE